MNTNRKRRLTRWYLTFFSVLILFEVIVVGRTLASAKVKPVMSMVNLSQINLDSDVEVSKPVAYDMDGAMKELTIRQAKDRRYARIIKHQANYPDKLLINLANNPELLTFVLEYPQKTSYNDRIALTTQELTAACPLFLQWDTRWGYQAYGDNNIAGSGCGPTALAMVVVGLTHNAKVNPAQVAQYATVNNYYEIGIGTKWELMESGPAVYGLTSEAISTDETRMKQELDAGKLLIVSVKAGDFTTGGHFIVVKGYQDGGFEIRDPFCIYRSNQLWSYAVLKDQMEAAWAMSR